MTPATLRRRLLAQPRLRNRYRDVATVPLGARSVLDAVIELVAGSGAELEYRPDPDIDGARSLVQIVALQAEAVGAEAEIEACLHVLLRAELVVLTDQLGLRVGLPEKPAASAVKAKTNRANSRFSVGPRPQGESDDDWAARKAAKRAQVEAGLRRQPSFALPIPGGLDGHSESQNRSQDRSHLALVDEAKPAGVLASAHGSMALASPGLSAAAAAVQYIEKAAAAASILPGAGGPVGVGGSAEANLGSGLAFSVALASTEAKASIPDLASAELAITAACLASPEAKFGLPGLASTGLASPEAKFAVPGLASPGLASTDLASSEVKLASSGLASVAAGLAREAAVLFPGWSPQMHAEAPRKFELYLQRGHTPAQIRAVMEAKRDTPCFGAGFFDKPLQQNYPLTGASAVRAPAGVEPPPVVRADVASDPEWSKLPAARQAKLSRVLDVLDMKPSGERDRRIAATRTLSRDEVALIGKRRPDILAVFGRDGPEEDEGRQSAVG